MAFSGLGVIHHGDCIEVMAALDAESVDAIVTDPPYGIRFMGKAWDGADIDALAADRRAAWALRESKGGGPASTTIGSPAAAAGTYDLSLCGNHAFQSWCEAWAIEALGVAKPGAHLLAFGGTRTYHRLAAAIEDAGWEIRDCLVWAYASGFPKSHNLTGEWQGWGTALKPAWEPIVLARKPLRGTVAANVERYGTGALNIDGCRIPTNGERPTGSGLRDSWRELEGRSDRQAWNGGNETSDAGRWPANLILTDPIFDGDTPGVVGGGSTPHVSGPASGPTWEGPSGSPSRASFAGTDRDPQFYGDSGTYSRFFLIPKADRADREPVLGGLPEADREARYGSVQDGRPHTAEGYVYPRKARANVHPTVKPTDLMRHLVRLVAPPGGLVLDPFLGSGTTALACEMEGFRWIGIEREAEYVAIAEARLNGVQKGLGLSA